MNNVQQSLKENEADILANLPEEHHENFKKEIESAAPPALLTDDEEAEAILEALPDEHMQAFKDNPTAHKCEAKPSIEEQKQAVLEMLDDDEHKKAFEENFESQLNG